MDIKWVNTNRFLFLLTSSLSTPPPVCSPQSQVITSVIGLKSSSTLPLTL